MHVRTLFKSSMFEIEIDGQPADRTTVLPGWNESDRVGIVITEAFGGIGASHLMQLAMTAFYDIKPSRRMDMPVYPEIYAFHVGKGHGAHAPYDIWPARREVVMPDVDHRDLLDAMNDRAITRLILPDLPERDGDFRPKEAEAAMDRIASCFLYDAGGRIGDGDLSIRGTDARTEYNANQALKTLADRGDPDRIATGDTLLKEADTAYWQWLRQREGDVTADDRARVRARREALREGGTVRETYRRIGIEAALRRLASIGS